MKNKFLSISVVFCFLALSLFAGTDDTAIGPKLKKFYIGNCTDGGIFSIANIKTPTKTTTGTLRFSYFFNIGVSFNYNINEHFGLYTGLELRNVGFIEKSSGITNKYRTYNIGIPLAIKIGNMAPKKMYGFLGGGVDFPINYKEKHFTKRSSKTKMNEWFSDRTPIIMPYVFGGVCFSRGIMLKLQYYTGNFFNPEFTTGTVKPYSGVDVHLIQLSIGFSMPYGIRHDMIKKKVAELQPTK